MDFNSILLFFESVSERKEIYNRQIMAVFFEFNLNGSVWCTSRYLFFPRLLINLQLAAVISILLLNKLGLRNSNLTYTTHLVTEMTSEPRPFVCKSSALSVLLFSIIICITNTTRSKWQKLIFHSSTHPLEQNLSKALCLFS